MSELVWTTWKDALSFRGVLRGKVVETGEQLVVASGSYGEVHVLSDKRRKWEAYTRSNSVILAVCSHPSGCVVLMYDELKQQFVIELFRLAEDSKWLFLNDLPDELRQA